MNKPIIQANESFLLNGDFTRGFSHWQKGPINRDWLGIDKEMFQGQMTSYLGAANESSVSQDLTVPKDLDAKAKYVLRFLCETRHAEPGLLRISSDNWPDTLEVDLVPDNQRDPKEDQARLAKGQPLEFIPKEYNIELQLPFKSQDKIRVSVFSPKNAAGDYYSKICITRIELHLHLEPLVLQTLKLDEQLFSPPRPLLYLCLGASGSFHHLLQCIPEPGNQWSDTHAALTSDDNPQAAVLLTPDWGVDQPVELPWKLDCPLIGDQESYLFTMNLLSQYTADPYPIEVSLGHHRLVFSEVHEAAYYPVFELCQSVQVGVQVASYYTGQTLEGLTVTWTVVGQGVQGTAVTGADGCAYFEFEPGAAGTFTIVASVVSLYYAAGVVTQNFEVLVLATDPWTSVQAVVANIEAPWAEKTGYPNRGSTYVLKLKLPTDSPLLGTKLWMGWSGDSQEQLGVTLNPPLDDKVPVDGVDLEWILTSADLLNGLFFLSLHCSMLLLPSASKPMSLARNEVVIGEVREANKLPVVDENEKVLLRVQVVHHIVSGDGDPVTGALVDWVIPEGIISTRSGAGGWASLEYAPKKPGDQLVLAQVRAHAEAVPIERSFAVKALATSPWRSQVNIFLDDNQVELNDLGVLCRRGETHRLKVVPFAGSTWIGKNIYVDWRTEDPAIGLVLSHRGVPKPLPASGEEWTLDSSANTSTSSLFALRLHIDGISQDRELSGRLVSADLTEELSVLLDQIPALLNAQVLYPCLGTIHLFNVLPNALSPLVGLMVSLTWTGTPADQLGATVQPPLTEPQPLSDGGAIWTLDFTASEQPGQFALMLALPQLEFVAIAKSMVLDHNKIRIEAMRESAVDPVVGLDKAWIWAWVVSHFTGKPVPGAPVTWEAEGVSSEVQTNAEGWSGFGYAPAVAGPQSVLASLLSPYDDYRESSSTEVTVHASDPWEDLKVIFDDQPAQLLGAKTYFPRRKGQHFFELVAANDSPLIGCKLALGMSGSGPAGLGIGFFPSNALGSWRPFTGVLQYQLNVGDLKDGSCALRLGAERLARLSPKISVSVGEGARVLEFSDRARTDQTLNWGDKLVSWVKIVSSISGKAMVGVTVRWSNADLGVKTTVTDYYGVARVSFVPTTPGTGELKATVGDDLNSDSIALAFTLNEPREIVELYEPTGSRQPPNESEAFAEAMVVSALTGMPLADVEVHWDYAGRALIPSMTDVDGIARLTFTMLEEGDGILAATVVGSIAGWAYMQIVYGGMKPVIESLTSPQLNIVIGQDANAEIKVVAQPGGQPLEGIVVRWTFAGRSLPDTRTDADGISRISFRPADTGTLRLTASVGFDARSSLDFNVEPLELVDMNVSSLLVQLGQAVTVKARVEPALPDGTVVRWSYPGLPDGTSITDVNGWAECSVIPPSFPTTGIEAITASVGMGTGSVKSLSRKIWVTSQDNEIVHGTDLFINRIPILLPNKPVSNATQNKVIDVGLLLTEGKGLEGHQFFVSSTHDNVVFEPAAGTPVTIEKEFTWTMETSALVGTRFAIAIYSPDFSGSIGLRFNVIAPGTEFEEPSDDEG